MALIVRLGEKGSSIKYKTFKEGTAIINRIKTGATVQIISIIWFCNKKRSETLYRNIKDILTPTSVVIIKIITMVKS